MLDQALLMRHAIKYCAGKHGVDPNNLRAMPTEVFNKFQEYAISVAEIGRAHV